MSKAYNEKPSKLLGVEDAYTSYCFDEACLLIRMKIEAGETPKFRKKYSSFSDIYKDV